MPLILQGVCVGDHWKDRLSCRQYGAHLPHVAGIAGQSGSGAQSVVLSGGCVTLRIYVYLFMCIGVDGPTLSAVWQSLQG